MLKPLFSRSRSWNVCRVVEDGARILFISHKIVIRRAILLPGRGGIGELTKQRARMFDHGKVTLEMLPLTQDVLELHLSCTNYQANVWLQADKVEMNVNPPTSVSGWQGTAEGLQIVWNRLASVPSISVLNWWHADASPNARQQAVNGSRVVSGVWVPAGAMQKAL